VPLGAYTSKSQVTRRRKTVADTIKLDFWTDPL